MEIIDLNPWWKTNEVEEEYRNSLERALLKDVLKFISDRQILSLVGLRRVGKTTLLHQIINYLLKRGIKKDDILYYNFDMGAVEIDELLSKYEDVTKLKIKDEKKIFVFLDEIQKLSEWHNKLKLIYDTNKNIKFFISGSASLFIEKKTKESLAGRTFSFQLSPLSFKEFLTFKKFSERNLELWKKELNELFLHYLKTGGFPEIINEKSDEKIKAYVKESVIDRLAYIDIPQVFRIGEPALLVKLISIISSNPGMILDYNNLADDLGRDRKTISSYLFYLEKAFLIKKFYNFSQNLLTSEKKGKKFYPASTAFSYFFSTEISKIVESLIAISLDTRFFYRWQNQEVDFVVAKDKRLELIEVKYKNKMKKDDISALKHFFNRFNKKFSMKFTIITKNKGDRIIINDFKINFVDILNYLLRLPD